MTRSTKSTVVRWSFRIRTLALVSEARIASLRASQPAMKLSDAITSRNSSSVSPSSSRRMSDGSLWYVVQRDAIHVAYGSGAPWLR